MIKLIFFGMFFYKGVEMNRFYQFILLLILFSFSTISLGNSYSPIAFIKKTFNTSPRYQQHFVEVSRRLPFFSNISATDDLEVIVTGGHSRQSVVLIGDPRAIAEISTEVQNKTL